MNNTFRLAGMALALCIAGSVQARAEAATAAAAPATQATAATSEARVRDPSHDDALAECESAVGNSIREIRGKLVQGLQFEGEARAANASRNQVDVKGAGHYRRSGGAPVAFRYSCAFDEATGLTSGVLFHETDGTPPPALPVWHADMSKISPESCESAVANSLQATHARASGIVFERDGLKLEPGADGRTALAGSGRLARAPGMQPSTFRYRCEFDAAGKVVSARATD